jgi:hypothetical protein
LIAIVPSLSIASNPLTQGQQRPYVVYDCDRDRDPEHYADPPLPTLRMVKLHDDGKSHDARRREHRGIRPCNQVLYALDKWIDVFDARPDAQIPSFDLA